MNKITIYVGDVFQYLRDLAIAADPDAKLINNTNYQNLTPGTYYTSIGDLDGLYQFSIVLEQATDIIYSPPVKWSHEDLKTWTIDYISAFANKKVVKGLELSEAADKSTMLGLMDTRKTTGQQLWAAGCSITAGIGVDGSERYGQLLSNQLQMPVSFLARLGASITWTVDQILRSDIQKDDIVVFGLTYLQRFPYFKDNKIRHVNISTYETDPTFNQEVDISFLDSQQLIYQAVTGIHQVINFCEKIRARLILVQLLGRGLENYLHQCSYYQMLACQHGRTKEDLFIDIGSDNIHPGPLMHKWYCDQILYKYQTIYGEIK